MIFEATRRGRRDESAGHHMSEPSSSSAPRPLRIFVVENHRDTLEAMQMYLELLGHTVESARDMQTALAELPRADCDVLFSDIGLPDGDGWELLRRLKLPRPIYAVAMSGFGLGADHVRSKEAGYRHHLLKPFNPAELGPLLQEAASELPAAR